MYQILTNFEKNIYLFIYAKLIKHTSKFRQLANRTITMIRYAADPSPFAIQPPLLPSMQRHISRDERSNVHLHLCMKLYEGGIGNGWHDRSAVTSFPAVKMRLLKWFLFRWIHPLVCSDLLRAVLIGLCPRNLLLVCFSCINGWLSHANPSIKIARIRVH